MAAVELSLGEYELEEPWGRLVEVGRVQETADLDASGPITTYVLKDRTTRTSSITCKRVEDAVTLARFLEAHLAELRRFLLEQVAGNGARLRALDTDVTGLVCLASWSFSTGDTEPARSTAGAIGALHEGFLGRLSPVEIDRCELQAELGGGHALLAVRGVESLRTDVQEPSGPAYRDVQLTAARQLA